MVLFLLLVLEPAAGPRSARLDSTSASSSCVRPVAAARDEKLTEPAAAPDADADPDTEPDTEPDPDAEPEPDTEPDTVPEPESEAEAEAEAEALAWIAYSTATCGVDSDK